MLQITKQGNSIVVKGLDHALYPYSGTLEIPCNSVITVVDDGDIVTFRSASNYDVLFSGLVTEITINGESVTKENVGDKFGAISNTASGGGGGLTPEQEEKLNNAVQIADYNADKEAQATIDDSQNASIEGLRGNIDGKQDKIADLNAIREGAEKGATALQNETDPIWTADKGNYYTKSEVDTSLETKADKTEIPSLNGYATEQWVGEQGYLTEHQPLKTINGETIVGNGNIEIQGGVGEETDPIWTAEKGNYYTKSEVNASLETKANKSEIPSLDGYATKVWVGEQGYLTEHQDISGKLDKTEAAQTYQPKGNYATKGEIPSLDGYATEGWVEGKGYLTEHQSLADYAKTSDVNTKLEKKQDVITDLNAIREGANKGATAIQEHQSLDGYATKVWVEGNGYLTEHQPLKTINGQTIVGDGNIEIQGGVGEETDPVWTAEKVNYYTKTEVNASLETKANKSEIPSLDGYATKVWVGEQGYLTEHQDISGKLDKTEAAQTYQPKGNYATKGEIPSLDGYATEGWVEGKGYLTEHQSLADYAKTSDVNTKLEKKQDVITDLNAIREGANKGATAIQEHQSLDGYATKVWVEGNGYLTEHQPLKTINGQTIVGDGNIEIQGGVGEETDPVWTAEKSNYYTKSEVDEIIGNINNALATLING